MFYVRKVFNDILMVYNSISCGLNLALWALYFGLPIFQHTLRVLLTGYSQCDMDVGEMFLDFPLQPDLRLFAGVDITHIKSRLDEEGWDHCRNRVTKNGYKPILYPFFVD